MKNRYISYEQMAIHLQRGRYQRSLALASTFKTLVSRLKKYLFKNTANPPKAIVCENTA